MQAAGHQFLAHPGFTADEHRLRGSGNGLHVLENGLHLLAAGHDGGKGLGLLYVVGQDVLTQRVRLSRWRKALALASAVPARWGWV